MNDLQRRKRNRLADELYRVPGAYFITICTRNRENLFWTDSKPASLQSIPLTDLGKRAEEQLRQTILGYEPILRAEKYVIMPNHVHILLLMQYDSGNACPDVRYVIRLFKRKVSQIAGASIWQKGFYDHILRNEDDYRMIWKYIDENPIKWNLDTYYPSPETEIP